MVLYNDFLCTTITPILHSRTASMESAFTSNPPQTHTKETKGLQNVFPYTERYIQQQIRYSMDINQPGAFRIKFYISIANLTQNTNYVQKF